MGLVLLGVVLVSIVVGVLLLLPARVALLARRRVRERRYGTGSLPRDPGPGPRRGPRR